MLVITQEQIDSTGSLEVTITDVKWRMKGMGICPRGLGINVSLL